MKPPMKLFLDTADVAVIKDMVPTGMVDGVTTNPSLIAKSGRNIAEVIAEICALVEGPISAEAVATDFETMVKEGDKLAAIAPNVVVKLPLTWDGLRACRHFADKGIKTNVTLCFSSAQASAARKAAGQQWGTLGYMVGEVWKGADEIRAQAYGPSDNPALSSAFDFPLRYGLVQALAVEESGKGGQGASVLDASWNKVENYPDHAMPNLMLGNHDLVRFGDLLERGNFNGADYWQRHKAAFSFMAARSGPITFYYGEEFGDEVPGFASQVGGDCAAQGLCDDHVARSDGKVPGVTGFVPSSEQSDLKQWLSQLLALRAAHPALYQGERVKLVAEGSVYGDIKQTAGEQVVYLLNVSTTPQSYAVPVGKLRSGSALVDLQSGENLAIGGSSVTVDLPPLTGRFLLVR